MKDHAIQTKTDQKTSNTANRASAIGPNAASAPHPGYGIDFLARMSPPTQALPTQAKFASAAPAQRKDEGPAKPNNTGLPDKLKTGIESLSGLLLDQVKVHYNSSRPAQLTALAYAQGTDIHLAPGQEKHLPHEAWHVVQQAQGRVKPTVMLKVNVPVNDDAGLEREADEMGAKAMAPAAAQRKGWPEEEEGLQPAQRAVPGQGGAMEHSTKSPYATEPKRPQRTDIVAQAAKPSNATDAIQTASPAGNVVQLSLAELNEADVIWTLYNNTHGTVNGIVTGDIARLQAAYAHYALPVNGGLGDVAADATNPFLENSVKGLLHGKRSPPYTGNGKRSNPWRRRVMAVCRYSQGEWPRRRQVSMTLASKAK